MDLLEVWDELAQAERETKRALKQARDKLRYARILRLTALFIYIGADNCPDAALTYVRRQRSAWLKELGLQDLTESWVVELITDDAYSDEYFTRIGTLIAEHPTHETEKNGHHRGPSYEEKIALKRQVRFLREWRAQQWVVSRNAVGIAPRTAAVAQQLNSASRAQREPHVELESPDRERSLVYRWRRRWAARVKTLRGGNSVALETMRTKVTAGRLI